MLQGKEVPSEAFEIVHAQIIHINGVLGDKTYLIGESFTIADIFIFSFLTNYHLIPDFYPPENVENLKEWSLKIRALSFFSDLHEKFFEFQKVSLEKIQSTRPTIYINWMSPISRSVVMTAAELNLKVNVKV